MVSSKYRSLVATFLGLVLTNGLSDAATSPLWGQNGELWLSTSRLPDFSHAGYGGGDVPIPDVGVVTNVKDFGAKGDGTTDDSDAFLNALSATSDGAVFIPAGRYKITEQIKIKKSNVVFRGAGQGSTTLYFPNSLNDVVGPAEDEAPGGSWSWSGGFFQIQGNNRGGRLATVTTAAKLGDKTLVLSTTSGLSVGQRIRVLTWNTDGTWGRYILGNVYPSPPNLANTKGSDFPCKIVAIQGNTITLDRTLRTDIRLAWSPEVDSDLPSLHDIGFEDMTLEFPEIPYPGHHNEPGFNGFDLGTVENCWIRRIRFINCDSGIFIHENSWFCTVQSVRFSAGPKRFVTGYDYLPEHPYSIAGHHGLVALSYAMDNLFTDFHFDMRMIHELSTENQSTGNVFASGDGLDMVLDHHRRAPYANLFTDINVGVGDRLWESGGDHDDGPESGMWETFWNIRATLPFGLPDKWEFNAVLINLVGITTRLTTLIPLTGNWLEAIVPSSLVPPNLYLSQVANRKGVQQSQDTANPSTPTGLQATANSSTQINLSWTASTDNVKVMGYKIFLNGTLLTTASGTTYAHTGLTPGTAYTYTVAAYDGANNTSPVSSEASATTPPSLIPPDITSPNSAAGRVGQVFTYQIEALNGPTSFNATGLPATIVLNTLTGELSGTPAAPGTLQVTLSASNPHGTGTQALTITIAPAVDSTAPTTPADFQTSVLSSNQIKLSWDASSDPGGAVAGYIIYRFGLKIAKTTSLSYVETGLASSTQYRYSVAAYDAAGNQSAQSSTRSAITLAAAAPSVPTRVTATATSSSQINLSWRASTDTGNSIAGYQIFRNGVEINRVSTTHFENTGLLPSKRYVYRISAYDNRGLISNLSGSVSATTLAGPDLPMPVLNLPSYMAVNGNLSVGYPQLNGIGFEWTLTPDTDTSSPGTASFADRVSAPAASFKTIGAIAELGTHALATGRYLITVRAFNSSGGTSPLAQATVTLVSADLTSVRVYPNPWRIDRHANVPVTFDHLPMGSVVKIFTVSGHFVKKLDATSDTIRWDLHNEAGDSLASGVYMYLITTADDQKTQGQFVLIH